MQQVAEKSQGDQSRAYFIVITAYLVPILVYGFYAVRIYSPEVSWSMLTIGLLISFFGAAVLILCFRHRELVIQAYARRFVQQQTSRSSYQEEEYENQSPAEKQEFSFLGLEDREEQEQLVQRYEQQIQNLQLETSRLDEECQKRTEEVEQLRQRNEELQSQSGELGEKIKYSSSEVQHRDQLLKEYQQTIGEQRSIIEKKQQYILKLENKVQDLNYEVKTLLQLGDLTNQSQVSLEETGVDPHPVVDAFKTSYPPHEGIEEVCQDLPPSSDRKIHTPYDAAMQLQCCIEKAKKLTGASHLVGKDSRFSDLGVDSYAIDLRRLFDSFRNESGAVILLYSQKESRLLFVNNSVRNLLGWSPEKFVADFTQLIKEGTPDWRHALAQLQAKEETQARFLVKTKEGEDMLVNCYLGMIPDGVFANHIIGVMYSS